MNSAYKFADLEKIDGIITDDIKDNLKGLTVNLILLNIPLMNYIMSILWGGVF